MTLGRVLVPIICAAAFSLSGTPVEKPARSNTPRGAVCDAAAPFAGFTSAAFTGANGGRERMHALCDAEFSGAHLCHWAEYQLANSHLTIPPDGAWVDASALVQIVVRGIPFYSEPYNSKVASPNSGRLLTVAGGGNCLSWNSGSGKDIGTALAPVGSETVICRTTRPIACCCTPSKEHFRGFTAAQTPGNAGGLEGMNAICDYEFAGSHLCHFMEYHRANSTISPPAGGAWISASAMGIFGGDEGSPTPVGTFTMASATAGRLIQGNGNDCTNWTMAGPGQSGTLILNPPNGSGDPRCSTQHRLRAASSGTNS